MSEGLVEGEERRILVVVAGGGFVGKEIARQLVALGCDEVIVIEQDPERVSELEEEMDEPIRFLCGDALDEDVLAAANLAEAQALVAALRRDRDNLFLCLAARQLHPQLRILSRISDLRNQRKFHVVGVDAVVSPARIGGRRFANAMLHPEVVAFTEALLQTGDDNQYLEDIPIKADTRVAGLRLERADLHGATGCVIVAVRSKRQKVYTYRPAPTVKLRPGGSVLALGGDDELDALAKLMAEPRFRETKQPPAERPTGEVKPTPER